MTINKASKVLILSMGIGYIQPLLITAKTFTYNTHKQNISQAKDTTVVMRYVTVTGNRKQDLQMRTSVNSVNIDRNFLRTNFVGSLTQSLKGVPGVKAMSIGSGQSKPAIRGLGFNRMAVAMSANRQ